MAKFAIHLQIPPVQYWALTWGEREALIAEWNDTNRKKR